MKKAKFALTAVAILAVIGGAVAFKANSQKQAFFSYTSTLIDNQVTYGCFYQTLLPKTTNPAGVVIQSYHTTLKTTNPAICSTRVIDNL